MRFGGKRPTIVVTTDVNGTTTPHNTFGELVRADGLFDEMEKLMKSYTSGSCKFSDVLPKMKHLASDVDRSRLEAYAHEMPLYPGVTKTFDDLTQSENVDTKVALSTTGFGGLLALVNKFRHGSLLTVAASPVLVHLLREEEKSCLIRPVTDDRPFFYYMLKPADFIKLLSFPEQGKFEDRAIVTLRNLLVVYFGNLLGAAGAVGVRVRALVTQMF